MNLNLYFRVIARFRVLVTVGVLLALCLGFFSYARVGAHGLEYRQPKQWASHGELLVTQNGFPLGQATVAPGVQPPGNLTTNAVLYASIAQSDVVQSIMLRHGPVNGIIEANAEATADGSLLPIIDIAGVATSQRAATQTLNRGTAALREFIRDQQDRNNTPANNRIILESLNVVGKPELLKSPSITRPIFVFLAVLTAILGLAFILENLRPRVRIHSAGESTKRDMQVDGRAAGGQQLRSGSGQQSS
jgi:hypothetical protein